MKKDLLNGVSRAFHKVGFQLKKHSPAILLVTGVTGVVVSAVMACKATTKLEETIKPVKNEINDIHMDMEAGIGTEKENKKKLATVYMQAGGKLVKLYAPAVTVGALSIGSILASHGILSRRYTGVSAAYAIVDKGFKDYRERVKERFGERVEYELKHGIKQEEVEVITTDEDGNEKIEKKVIDVATASNTSPYARFFDETNPYYEKPKCKADENANLFFLRQVELFANEKLREKGFLYLNQVYEMLGFEETYDGQIVGWVYDEKNPVGDNYIDFGLYDINKKATREFVNGHEKAILLDFNVDGNILKLMK